MYVGVPCMSESSWSRERKSPYGLILTRIEIGRDTGGISISLVRCMNSCDPVDQALVLLAEEMRS